MIVMIIIDNEEEDVYFKLRNKDSGLANSEGEFRTRDLVLEW